LVSDVKEQLGVSCQTLFVGDELTIRLEDWYLALVQASALPPTMDDVFSYEDMQDLVKTIDAEQDPIPTRWLNAILGRVFFGLYRTAFVEEVSRFVNPMYRADTSSSLGES
jgi:hypothetical protein